MAFHRYTRCPNIQIFEYVPYRNEVIRYLDLIATTFAGKTLYKSIAGRPRHISIIPYVSTPLNPTTDPEVPGLSSMLDALDTGSQIQVPINLGFGTVFVLPMHGTGRGTNVVIRYHPAAFRQLMANVGGVLPGAGPGEMLYHELIHAMQALRGRLDLTPAPVIYPDMDGFNEFCAVVGANIYRSERGFTTLRSNHVDFTGEKTDSVEFFNFYEEWLKKWFDLQRDFCTELARSPARFNPLGVAADDLGIDVPVPMALP